MTFAAIKMGVRLIARRSVFFLKRYAPQILVGTGVAGFAATAVVSGKAALKAKDILDERDNQLNMIEQVKDEHGPDYSNQDYEQDKKIVKTQTAWKLIKTFAPPVTLGAASAALIFGGHHMMGRRAAAALASAYEAQQKLHKYRENVVDQLGGDVDQKLAQGLKLDRLETSENLKKLEEEQKKLPVPEKDPNYEIVEWTFCEETCGSRFGWGGTWKPDPTYILTKLYDAYNYASDRLITDHTIEINDILRDEFGASKITNGNLGFIRDENLGIMDAMDWGISDLFTVEGKNEFIRSGQTSVTLRFKVRKEPIEKYYDAINRNYTNEVKARYAANRYYKKHPVRS